MPFTAAQAPERFTSDGPRRVFFNADGSPITPGNYSSTGGALRQKPDFTGADGVVTSVDGFERFFGTSAAAPHLAAIAALVLSGNPETTNAEFRDAFATTALDLAPAGIDARTGHGVVRADLVLAETGATPQPLVRASDPTITPVTSDGDAFLEPGEAADLARPGDERRRRYGDGSQRPRDRDEFPCVVVTSNRGAGRPRGRRDATRRVPDRARGRSIRSASR